MENEEYKRVLASSDMEHKINLLGQEKDELKRQIEKKVCKLYRQYGQYGQLACRVHYCICSLVLRFCVGHSTVPLVQCIHFASVQN